MQLTNYHKNIVDYYAASENAYKDSWDLNNSLAIHYGYWDEKVKNFSESLLRMNEVMMEVGQIKPTDKVLDAGCGIGGSSIFLAERIGCNVTGISLSEKQVSKAKELVVGRKIENKVEFEVMNYCATSFPDESFDSVFCSEVFEHVFNLDEIITEIRRVMKPGGKILITVPFLWNEHEVPYDFGRYSSYGIKYLLEKHEFEILDLQKSGNFARVNCQMTALYFYSIIDVKNPALNFLLRMLFIIPINILGSLFMPLLPKNSTLYFNNVVLATKKS